jgi:SSS family solute:Na+ symporter
VIPALVLYGAAVLAVGLATGRAASRSRDAYLVGDRSFGPLLTWAALSSTTIGGSTTLVLAALVGRAGLPGLWLDVAGALGLAALGLFLARKVRETGAVTIAEVIGRFYGARVRQIAAVLVVLAEIVWFALLAEATMTVLVAATPWNPTAVLVSTAAVFVAYTLLGGQRAVVGTDLLQFALMAAGLVGIALPLAAASLSRTGVSASLLSLPFSSRLGPLDAAALLVLVGLPHLVGSDVWSKLLSARDAQAARKAALGASLSKLVFGASTATIALAGVGLGIAGPAEELFPRTVVALSGPGLAPLLLVAMVATMQSSSDSVLLSASAATVNDIFPPRFATPAWGRLFVGVWGAAGLLVALALRDLLETFRLGYTLFASGLILPTLAAFAPGLRVPRAAAGAAMIAGGGAAMAERFLRLTGLDPVLVGTCVNALVLAAGLAVGRASR